MVIIRRLAERKGWLFFSFLVKQIGYNLRYLKKYQHYSFKFRLKIVIIMVKERYERIYLHPGWHSL